ncbi:hypothetical protein HYW67_01205 [Candidatus Parcubacteria bacterium]|nr:hypothetical protein [Candidatus Parcubacteria bacterium]
MYSDILALPSWADTVVKSLSDLWLQFMAFLPVFVSAVVVFLIGWLVAAVLAKVVQQIVKGLRIDQLFEQMGVGRALARGGLNLDTGRFIGEVVKWFVIVAFLLAASDILQLNDFNDFLKSVLDYIPNIVVAVLILLAGAMLANFLERSVEASVAAAELKSGKFLGAVTRWAVWVFAILAALVQLNVAAGLLQTLFMGVVGAFALAVGLAFGLGGRDAASDWLEKIKKDVTER